VCVAVLFQIVVNPYKKKSNFGQKKKICFKKKQKKRNFSLFSSSSLSSNAMTTTTFHRPVKSSKHYKTILHTIKPRDMIPKIRFSLEDQKCSAFSCSYNPEGKDPFSCWTRNHLFSSNYFRINKDGSLHLVSMDMHYKATAELVECLRLEFSEKNTPESEPMDI